MTTRTPRPSRLLNLNNSPKEQKSIATINATRSPFLRLPPELRCRIYDHLFASTAIHIRSVEHEDEGSGRHYKLSLCENPSHHAETPIRYVEHYRTIFEQRYYGCTIYQSDDKPFNSLDIGLGLLGTCRQLYHEAVLRPFTQISFATLTRCYHKYSGVQRFISALMPAQGKAIARLRITLSNALTQPTEPEYPNMLIGPVPTKSTINKLKGLTDLEIVLAPVIDEEFESHASLFMSGLERDFVRTPGMQLLMYARLRSLRVTMEAIFDDYGQDGRVPTFEDRGHKDLVEAWLRETEMELQFGSVRPGEGALPEFGMMQDDEKVSIPPWATPEGIEKRRIEAEKEMEEHVRLQQEQAVERRLLMNSRNRGRPRTDVMI